ncbi:MAG: NAD(P)H-binding protein [Olsenella sp.]|jgi:putative NADH-flavin reductase|nr:NAD(P)H-binding protein [Olsenella sp.]
MSQNNTKKIAVVAANGRVGSLVVAEAVRRGFDVTAIAREESRTQAQHFLKGDALTIGRDQLEGFDAVVDAVGGWSEDTLHLIPDAAKHLAARVPRFDWWSLAAQGRSSWTPSTP